MWSHAMMMAARLYHRIIWRMAFALIALCFGLFVRISLNNYTKSQNRRDFVPTPNPILELALNDDDVGVVPSEERLTVEETIGLVLRGNFPHLEKRANPQATPDLWAVIEIDDDGLALIHSSALGILGYIGNDSDAERMMAALQGYSGLLNAASAIKVGAILAALGHMARRGVGAARKSLDEMSDLSYWKGRVKYRPDEELGVNDLPPELESLRRVYGAHSLWKKREFELLYQNLLSTIPNPNHRQRMAGELDPTRLRRSLAEMILRESKKPTEDERRGLRFCYDSRERLMEATSRVQREMWNRDLPPWQRPNPLQKSIH